MDLEHPAITKTLKTGYPDDAGKPTNKIYYTPDYSRDEEETQMEFEDYTIRELLDMDAKITIDLFSGTKEKALSIVEKFKIDDIEDKSIENTKIYWIQGNYVNAQVNSFYNEVFK